MKPTTLKRLVVMESPLSGDYARNVAYAKRALLDCIRRGDVPMAGHLLYVQVLDDKKPEDRALGIECHLSWIRRVDAVVVYQDLGISKGMQMAIDEARGWQVPIEYRGIGVGAKP